MRPPLVLSIQLIIQYVREVMIGKERKRVQSLLNQPAPLTEHGQICNFVAYPYENYIGQLDKQTRGNSKVLEQVGNLSHRLDTNK